MSRRKIELATSFSVGRQDKSAPWRRWQLGKPAGVRKPPGHCARITGRRAPPLPLRDVITSIKLVLRESSGLIKKNESAAVRLYAGRLPSRSDNTRGRSAGAPGPERPEQPGRRAPRAELIVNTMQLILPPSIWPEKAWERAERGVQRKCRVTCRWSTEMGPPPAAEMEGARRWRERAGDRGSEQRRRRQGETNEAQGEAEVREAQGNG